MNYSVGGQLADLIYFYGMLTTLAERIIKSFFNANIVEGIL